MNKIDYWTQICALTYDKGIPRPEAEFVFAAPRKWRFDYAWPHAKTALEIEGGAWSGGRHVRGAGFKKDQEKYNRAAVLGWRVIRCTPSDIWSGIDSVAECLRSVTVTMTNARLPNEQAR